MSHDEDDSGTLSRRKGPGAWVEWVRWGLTGLVIPLGVFLIDLRQSNALQAVEITNLRAELQTHAVEHTSRIERLDVQQRAMDNLLARVDTTVTVVVGRINDIASSFRRK